MARNPRGVETKPTGPGNQRAAWPLKETLWHPLPTPKSSHLTSLEMLQNMKKKKPLFSGQPSTSQDSSSDLFGEGA